MKKNFIFGLSLLLSSVATLNLTSCETSFDDEVHHSQKSYVAEETTVAYMGCGVQLRTVGKNTSGETISAAIENYLKGELAGIASNVEVKLTAFGSTISIEASKANATAVANKLKAMNADPSSFSEYLKTNHPEVTKLSFSISQGYSSNVLFNFNYEK